MERRKEKRQVLKAQKKIKIDFSLPVEVLLERYKMAYGDTVEESKLREYIKHQKLIEDAKNNHRNKVKANV